MRIRFQRYGGLVPAVMQLGVELCVEELDVADADEVRGLLERAGLGAPPPASEPRPDQLEYEIEVIDDDGISHTAVIRDLTENSGPLVHWLEQRAKREKGGGG